MTNAYMGGCKAWRALIAHYVGTGKLNKHHVKQAKEEIARLHHKDKRIFPFERYVTKLKVIFYASIVAAKTSVFKDHRSDFNAVTSFPSGLIININSSA